MQSIYDKLSDTLINNPNEFWKILKEYNQKEGENRNEIKDLISDLDKIVKHVQEQGDCNNINKTFKQQIEIELKAMEDVISESSDTDHPITINEIKKVLKKLKMWKANGPDGIVNEVFKYSSDVTIKSLAKLFNLILKTSYFPAHWNESFLILLHKSGNRLDPSNYRGISLINCIAKIFSAILNERLKIWMKDIYSHSQFGFRENHRTSDSLFILKSLINKYVHKNKKKLYLCFVDLKKAFDSVWREGLLYKMAKLGVGKHFYNTIKNMLSNTKIALKMDGHHSNFF